MVKIICLKYKSNTNNEIKVGCYKRKVNKTLLYVKR